MTRAPGALPTECLNCGEGVSLAFCPRCGQKVAPRRLTLREAAGEMVSAVFSFDSKIARTIPLFLFKTATLTRAFLDGKRVRYTSPLRLFLAATLLLGVSLSVEGMMRDTKSTGIIQFSTGSRAKKIEAVEGGTRETSSSSPEASLPEASSPETASPEESLSDKPRQPASDPIADLAAGMRSGQGEDGSFFDRFLAWKEKRISAMDPGERTAAFNGSFLRLIPTAAFFLLPVFAFVLRLAMLGTHRTYPEMLTFLMHIQAWTFVLFAGLLWAGRDAVSLLMLFLPIYFLWCLKSVFGLSRFGMVLRGFIAGFLFVPTLIAGVVGMIAVSFALV